jgi:membrane associated rhomboid family serine protease
MTLLMLALVAAGFGAQLAAPELAPLFGRTGALLHRGELWRAVTSLFVQGGGISGTVFNLTILLLIGAVAEQHLGARRWLIVYLGAGVVTEFLALAWQPEGAGNSIAVFGLAGAMAAWPRGARTGLAQTLIRLVAAAAALALLVQHDVHGIGFWVGALIAAALSWKTADAAQAASRVDALAAAPDGDRRT